jgi:hypothetical protein
MIAFMGSAHPFSRRAVYHTGGSVIVRPAQLDDVLRNPGMGIQTFQRFAGQALNEGTEWSERGPIEVVADESPPPDFPPSSVAYCRWYWRDLEPHPGEVRWAIIDLALAEARRHDQTLALRLMPYGPDAPIPDWYRASGARAATEPGDDGVWHPDVADRRYAQAWGALVQGLGSRYDGHPDLEYVDIATFGFWGEGWSPHLPELPVQTALMDLYFDALPNTLLLANIDQAPALAYAASRGAGWRLDCLGDLAGSSLPGGSSDYPWCHMFDKYPQNLARAGVRDVWQSRPVSLEVCWVVETWRQRGWDVTYSLEQALAWHASTINLKSSPIPSEVRPAIDALQRRLGYRLAVRQATYPERAARGQTMPVTMWWQNLGVAPPYRRWVIALQLRSAATEVVMAVDGDVRTWLPGDALVEQAVAVPADLPTGAYSVAVALLDRASQLPKIALANDGRRADGWYELGPIEVV